ncbi:DUF305 domain-containing protein [Streptomyces albidochromogenes]|uniref:DUF305 domain-containing protein n=1 Tax=Streptomyces albidochromogenes TaxID=329524 RepID=A0ABW6FY06_9ACTN
MTAYRFTVRRTAAVAAAATAAVLLAACGGGGDSPAAHAGHGTAAAPSASSAGRAWNAADVSFAKGMIPHHRQAVAMAGLAATRARSTEVRQLAARIEKAQGPEIRTLSGWLTAWGEDVPEGGATGGHAWHSAAGMMAAEEMDELEKSSGEAFDTAFLRMMVEHHEGAVAMAGTERSEGAHRPARDMAGDIVTSQSAEIRRMKALLGAN